MNIVREIKKDYEIFETSIKFKEPRNKVTIVHVNQKQASFYFDVNVYMKSSLFVLVLNGSIHLDINFKEYVAKKDAIILLSFGHFFKLRKTTDDFEGIILYVGKGYVDEMYSTDMIYQRIKYGVKMHSIPLLILNRIDAHLLEKRLSFVEEIIRSDNHRYYKEMVLNTLLIFFLDLSNVIEQEGSTLDSQNISRDEIYFQKFLEILVNHYKKEHLVDFYANNLHITPHYLTLIVKRLSGQTVSDFIFQLLYSEAKILLQQPDLTIQQIATNLYFSDQSSFGKFFKRKNGISPKEFRLKNYIY